MASAWPRARSETQCRFGTRATGRIVKTLPEQNVVSLAFAPDGQTLGVGGRDQVVVWNLETGRVVFKREEALGQFRIAFSPMGTLLVIGKRGGPLGTRWRQRRTLGLCHR